MLQSGLNSPRRPATWCYDGAAVTRGSCSEQKNLQKEKQHCFYLPCFSGLSPLTLSVARIKDLGFSKHLQVFISIERFIGLPCNSCCTFAFLTSGAGMVYSVQSSWFTSYQRIMYVLYSVVAKVTFIYHVQIRMWWCYQGHEYIFNCLLWKSSCINLFFSACTVSKIYKEAGGMFPAAWSLGLNLDHVWSKGWIWGWNPWPLLKDPACSHCFPLC